MLLSLVNQESETASNTQQKYFIHKIILIVKAGMCQSNEILHSLAVHLLNQSLYVTLTHIIHNHVTCVCRCIDGYSRKIIWLKASYSNHKPGLIAAYFVPSSDQFGGYPSRVRTDCGTENVTVAAIQALVTGSTASHVYGTSPGNQRIESWWSFFRRSRSQWWIELFESLQEFGAFHPGSVQETECMRYCFMAVVQKDLDAVRQQWNTHRIRPSAGARCLAGIPDELFYLPPSSAVDCMLRDPVQLHVELQAELEEQQACQDSERESYFDYLCSFHNWHAPTDADSAVALYLRLLSCL